METLKANIIEQVGEDQDGIFSFTAKFSRDIELGTTECKIAQMLTHSLCEWAYARKAIHGAAKSTERALKNIQSDLLRGLVSTTTFLDTSRIEEYTQKQSTWQDMAMQAMYLIGLDKEAMQAVFNKINALEFAGYAQ